MTGMLYIATSNWATCSSMMRCKSRLQTLDSRLGSSIEERRRCKLTDVQLGWIKIKFNILHFIKREQVIWCQSVLFLPSCELVMNGIKLMWTGCCCLIHTLCWYSCCHVVLFWKWHRIYCLFPIGFVASGDGGTWVWTTSPELLLDSRPVARWELKSRLFDHCESGILITEPMGHYCVLLCILKHDVNCSQDCVWNAELHRTGGDSTPRSQLWGWYLVNRLHHVRQSVEYCCIALGTITSKFSVKNVANL